MPLVYTDAVSGEIAYFVTFYGALQSMLFGFLLLGFVAWIADERVRNYVPSAWMIHEESKSSSAFRGMDIAEYGGGLFCRTLFYSGLTLCTGIIVHHMLFYKKPPRRPRNEAGSAASAELSYAEVSGH